MKRSILRLVAAASLAGAALAQGRGYFNPETPQVRPMATATVQGQDYLLVCNTPDNSVAIFDIPSHTLVARAPVGLEPCSVAVREIGGEVFFYTANFLGDSISQGVLFGAPGALGARMIRTVNVGDEPMDMDFYDVLGTTVLFVTLQTTSSYGMYDALTLLPVVPHQPGPNPCAPPSVQGSQRLPLVLGPADPLDGSRWGIKEPRAIRIRGDLAYVLGFKGGDVRNGDLSNPSYPWHWDFDVAIVDLKVGGAFVYPPPVNQSLPPAYTATLGLNSTNFNMELATNGDLYVVGGEAQNFDNDTKIEVRNEETLELGLGTDPETGTGFVQSTLWRIAGPVTGASVLDRANNRRNTNFDIALQAPVAKAEALAMPTDLALYEVSGAVEKVFVSAFGSDRIGVFRRPQNNDPNIATWTRGVIDFVSPPSGLSAKRGPRDLLLHRDQVGSERLYVLNRFDSTVVVIDPVAETEAATFPILAPASDPQPAHVLLGRHFLYSADLSANGFSSCASCHTDGRTDRLAWRLGNPDGIGPLEAPPTAEFIFSVLGGPSVFPEMLFFVNMVAFVSFDPDIDPGDPSEVDDKREMITQSLQGLLNFEVPLGTAPDDRQIVRDYFSNAPFHWRGDKPRFLDFNEAFATLMGINPPFSPPPDLQGIDPADMETFEEFVFSISYPPNPQQRADRVPSPDEDCDPGNPSDDRLGGLEGQRLFNERPTGLGNRSCAQCHSYPEGSNNLDTILGIPTQVLGGYVSEANVQPIESAAMRGLIQKEALLQSTGFDSDAVNVAPRIGHFGLNHSGTIGFVNPTTNLPTSINTFIQEIFGPSFSTQQDTDAVKQYSHEFDWGVAPIVGASLTVTGDTVGLSGNQTGITLGIDQAKLGNAAVAVQAHLSGQRMGFWYWPAADLFFQENTGGAFPSLSRAQLEALPAPGTDDQLTFHAVPLGSERRVASTTGIPDRAPALTPANLSLQPAVPNTHLVQVPTLTGNVVPGTGPGQFDYSAPMDPMMNLRVVDDPFLLALRLFQTGLMTPSYPSSPYGISNLRHEASRRLRVAGDGILPGAKLHVYSPKLDSAAVPAPTPPSQWVTKNTQDTVRLTFTLHSTDDTAGGSPVWETAEEIQPISLYQLMLGGPLGPGVRDTLEWSTCGSYQVFDQSSGMWVPTCGTLPGIPNPTPVPPPPLWDGPYAPGQSPFDPDGWNWHWVEVENPDGSIGNGGYQQIVLQ